MFGFSHLLIDVRRAKYINNMMKTIVVLKYDKITIF